MKINFIKVKDLTRGLERTLLYRLLPKGKVKGSEYVSLNPTRKDCNLGSFTINLRSFKWADFATQSKGGDIISLWAYVRGLNQLQAALEILTILGKDINDVSN